MNGFQIVATVCLVPSSLWCIYAAFRRRRRRLLVVAAVYLTGAYVVLHPDTSTKIANRLGIGRGTDLVAYLTALGLLGLAYGTLALHRRLSTQITDLTRQLALAELPAAKERAADAPRTREPAAS